MSPNNPKHGKNNPSTEKKQGESEEESTKRHVYIEPGVKVDLVDDLKQQYKASQGESTTHSNKILFWTKISAALLLLCPGSRLYKLV